MDLSIVNNDYYLSGMAALIGDIDKQLMVMLRDGRTLIAFLRSLDQFGNLVLHQAFERICIGRQYADIPRGLFVIRGENVLFIGELDFHQSLRVPLIEVTIEEILKLQKEDIEKKGRIEKLRQKAMIEHGLVDEGNPIEEHY
ncbi:unnamed protein product [Rotaria magnacalcarata]|uniref:U6 snRNA-associated Sm-like protein LSm1 n=1 Tax=Rotaria magnacalcarata TaxID=392030 RepID=A0A816C8I8_9BILA|nr:unnamed protein product [Rotaria magnacalcarata]CAF1619625.1 unnamed protein product [Rotaria magnacalcarata]CAF1985067.1 unnamed protein product [Rotaria magnacalcarata]CAF2079777.1 unnamed protein product [Rotaria magnacalcarata]CAF2085544.1 unnamed protein product [Rotaria magnacalcarata]